jgi:hypothetical protein
MNKLIRLTMDMYAPPQRLHGWLILSTGNMFITCDRFLATVFADTWTDKQLEDRMVLFLENTNHIRKAHNIEYSVTHVIEYG